MTSPEDHPVTGPELVIDPRSPIPISPPLRGPAWLSANSCCDAATTHRSGRVRLAGAGTVAKPETFAVDWIQLHGDQPFAADGAAPQHWFGYGADVHAAVSGTVTGVRDGLPEATPGALPTGISPADTAGKHIIVRIRPDSWASTPTCSPEASPSRPATAWSPGRSSARSATAATPWPRTCTSGSWTGHARTPANSLPFVLDDYTVVGTADRDSYLAAFSGAGPLKLRPHSSPTPQAGTFPLNLAVNDLR